jgi:AraC family transcriptional regulator of adaptative response / DNA-3-methyladenine glycosylase II
MTHYYQQARLSRDHRFDGKFFIAVKTTKIFCRPICPANAPLEKNVEYFELAEHAMLSGYRPCLRCRPDSAPDSFAWQGVDTTINRATRLLKEFPESSIDLIAEKLGISARYLRQLFQKNLGMSPKQYQLFNKVLFAKQLLHQSQLSVEHIAQASGFGSARRLQDHFKKITGLTPQNIRHPKSAELSCDLVKLKMAYRPPYNWQHIKDFLFLRSIAGIETVTEHSYSRTFIIGKNEKVDKGWFKIQFVPQQHYFEVEIKLGNLSHFRTVLTKITRIFDLQADTQAIQNQLLKAGVPEQSIISGLRLPGVWDTFEAGCRAILGQQISVKAAINLLSNLTHHLGEKSTELLYFPTPEAVANSDLAFLKIPSSRKQTLIDFARYFSQTSEQDKEICLDDWLNLKGIGPWTVAYAKMRGLSSPDIWLKTDLVIKKQLSQYIINSEQVKPWRSYLTFQLWSMA